jgi:two-component SAPR family response regulator
MKILVIDNDEAHIKFFKEYLYQYDVYFSTTEEETIKALTTFEYSIIYINGSVQNDDTIVTALKSINKETKIFVHSDEVKGDCNKPFALVALGFYVRSKPYSMIIK